MAEVIMTMIYSERKLRIEYQISRSITLALSLIGALGSARYLRDNGIEYSGLLATAFIFFPGLWAFYTLKVHHVFAKHCLTSLESNVT